MNWSMKDFIRKSQGGGYIIPEYYRRAILLAPIARFYTVASVAYWVSEKAWEKLENSFLEEEYGAELELL